MLSPDTSIKNGARSTVILVSSLNAGITIGVTNLGASLILVILIVIKFELPELNIPSLATKVTLLIPKKSASGVILTISVVTGMTPVLLSAIVTLFTLELAATIANVKTSPSASVKNCDRFIVKFVSSGITTSLMLTPLNTGASGNGNTVKVISLLELESNSPSLVTTVKLAGPLKFASGIIVTLVIFNTVS